jgi:ATP-dependent helicase/nuclease subunit A
MSEQITSKWSKSLTPSYIATTAKKLGLKGKSRPDWEASGDYGHEWGSAVHELLEVCHKSPTADLRPTALRLARDYNLGSSRVDELISTVQSVTASDIWKRAQASKRCYSELPFETTITGDDGKPQLVRGVIDLIFEEEDGWVIVDYKTDSIAGNDYQISTEYYRGQLTEYAAQWHVLTGAIVKETGVYFTLIDSYSSYK